MRAPDMQGKCLSPSLFWDSVLLSYLNLKLFVAEADLELQFSWVVEALWVPSLHLQTQLTLLFVRAVIDQIELEKKPFNCEAQ